MKYIKPKYQLPDVSDPRGNIFCIIGDVSKILRKNGYMIKAQELVRRITINKEAKSYDEAIQIIKEYVDVS